MQSFVLASVGAIIVSGAVHAAIIPRQDSSFSVKDIVAQAASEAGLGPATLKPSQKVDYVLSVGDSFSAGVGSNGRPDFFEASSKCSRYEQAWPLQLMDLDAWGDLNGGSRPGLTFGACTGAETFDMIDHQLKQGDPDGGAQYTPIGKPQLAVMTIGGNDLGFSDAINDCIYRVYDPHDCEATLHKMENLVTSETLAVWLSHAFARVLAAGIQAGGASPANSFQLYVSEYIGFWNHDDKGCDDVSWCMWYAQKIKLTTAMRLRMNTIVENLNQQIKAVADEMAYVGVVYVGGVNHQFDTHRFCEPAPIEYLKDPIGSNTWFWSWGSPGWEDGSEGPSGAASAQDVNDFGTELLEAIIMDPAVRATVSETNPPWNVSPAFKSEQQLLEALQGSENQDVSIKLADTWRRMFHPKGTAYGVYANAFMAAIRDNRGKVNNAQTTSPDQPSPNPPPQDQPPPPPPAFTPGECAFHLREEWKAIPYRTDNEVAIEVKLFDFGQKEIGHLDRTVITSGVALDIESALPWTVHIVPNDTGEDWEMWNYEDFTFSYGDKTWRSPTADGPLRCNVGERAQESAFSSWWSQDMDCFFPC